jgi:predicted O-methyltransferase YrrM
MTSNLEEVRQLAGQIDGWLSQGEGELLYRLARDAPRIYAIVEIGAWKGKSTVWLARGSKDGPKNRVYSIDPHAGSEAHRSEGEANTYATFVANLRKARVWDVVFPLVTTSEEAAKSWQEGVGLLWIDGSHQYEDVRRDLECWMRHLVVGGVVALHDCDKPGPARAIQECLNRSHGFATVGLVDSIVVGRRLQTGSLIRRAKLVRLRQKIWASKNH